MAKQARPAMTIRASVAHLHARVIIQKHRKTSYNRLRWTGADIEAVETILRGIDRAARVAARTDARE